VSDVFRWKMLFWGLGEALKNPILVGEKEMSLIKEHRWISAYWIILIGVVVVVGVHVIPKADLKSYDIMSVVMLALFGSLALIIRARKLWAGVTVLVLVTLGAIGITVKLSEPFELLGPIALLFLCIRGTAALVRVRKYTRQTNAQIETFAETLRSAPEGITLAKTASKTNQQEIRSEEMDEGIRRNRQTDAKPIEAGIVSNLGKAYPKKGHINRTAKKVLDVVFFVMGPVLFVVGFIGGFQANPEDRYAYQLFKRGRLFHPSDSEIAFMALGIGLICLGFVLKSWRNGAKGN
jgi:hypothetical protein